MKLKPGMAVHCDTEEKANIFLKECHRQGLKWRDGKSLIDYNNRIDSLYFHCESDTVYHINENGLSYGDLCGVTASKLISFDDLLKTTENKKCKVYTKPKFIHDNVEKVIINEPCVVVFLDTGEKGISKCCPDDKFDEELGYKIAYQRTQIQRAKLNLRMQELRLKYLIKHS